METQWSKSSEILALSLGLIWLTRPLTIHNTVHWSVRHTQSFRCPLIYPIKWDNWLLRCLKKANNFFTNFWHSRDKSDFLPILQKMQNITIIYERNACQFRLKVHVAERKILQVRYLMYGWLFYKVHLPPPKKWQQNRTKMQNFIGVQPQPKQLRSITITFLVSTPNSK